MKAGETVFQNLLNGQIQYVVPLYQRTYSWGEEQWEQLWDDVLEVYALPTPRNHFIGSVVTQQIHTSPEGTSKYTLIDGQQRMTTLFILLGVIRQRADTDSTEWGDLALRIQKTCLTNEFASEDERLKLMPTQADRMPFKSVIDGNAPTEKTQIGKAKDYFEQVLEGGDSEGKAIDLTRLYRCIVHHLDMVSIHLETSDSPNRIFESLNNTGMPLSVADLVRNYVLMNIPDLQQQEHAYNEFWYPMEQSFPEGQITTDFFWRYLMMNGSLPRQDDTYEEVQERFKGYTTPAQYRAALQDFVKFARHYVHIIGYDSEGLSTDLLEQIGRLNQWEVAVAYPFLMRSLDNVASGNVSESDLIEVMRFIESFVIRRQVCGIPTNSLRSIFARMSGQVDFSDFVANSRDHLLANRWPSDENFLDSFVQFDMYSRGRVARARLVLWTLERAFGHKETPQQTSDVTIEHIMPQTLSDKWKDYLGTNWPDVHAQWLNTIGNLTLTGYNPELSNKPYTEKQNLLGSSNFALSESLLDIGTWGETAIQQRARELADMAVDIWHR